MDLVSSHWISTDLLELLQTEPSAAILIAGNVDDKANRRNGTRGPDTVRRSQRPRQTRIDGSEAGRNLAPIAIPSFAIMALLSYITAMQRAGAKAKKEEGLTADLDVDIPTGEYAKAAAEPLPGFLSKLMGTRKVEHKGTGEAGMGPGVWIR